MSALGKAKIKTVYLPNDMHLRLEFDNERDFRDAYAELELVMEGRVMIPADLRDAQLVNRLRATCFALASALKTGTAFNDYHQRLLEDI